MSGDNPVSAPQEKPKRKYYEKFKTVMAAYPDDKRLAEETKKIGRTLTEYCVTDIPEWPEIEVDIILGLHEHGELTPLLLRVTEVNFNSESPWLQPAVLEKALALRDDLLKGEQSEIIKVFYVKFPGIIFDNFSDLEEKPDKEKGVELDDDGKKFLLNSTNWKQNLKRYSSQLPGLLWHKRNYPERAALFLSGTATTSAVFGALLSHAQFLATASDAISKILPTALTTFANSHTVPPAALAFYLLASTLAATALLLCLASVLYRCRRKLVQSVDEGNISSINSLKSGNVPQFLIF